MQSSRLLSCNCTHVLESKWLIYVPSAFCTSDHESERTNDLVSSIYLFIYVPLSMIYGKRVYTYYPPSTTCYTYQSVNYQNRVCSMYVRMSWKIIIIFTAIKLFLRYPFIYFFFIVVVIDSAWTMCITITNRFVAIFYIHYYAKYHGKWYARPIENFHFT